MDNREINGVLARNPEEISPLKHNKRRQEINKMNLNEIRLKGVDWFNMAQDSDKRLAVCVL